MPYKRRMIILYAALSLLVVSLSIAIFFPLLKTYEGIIIGSSLMVIAIPFHLLGKKVNFLYILSMLLNSIGIGLAITSYYVFKSYPLDFIDFLVAGSISLLVLGLFAYLSSHKFFIGHAKLWLVLTIIVCLGLSTALWLGVNAFSGLTFYLLNITYFFMIAMIAASEDMKNLNRELSLVLFGAFILVTLVVLIIITEGEALSGGDFSLDLSGFSGGKKKRK